jgi:uncharacterized protein YukE
MGGILQQGSVTDGRAEHERAVRQAAQEERAARTALIEGMRPAHRHWQASGEVAYRARLARWQAASEALIDALDGLHAVLCPHRCDAGAIEALPESPSGSADGEMRP